MGYKQGEPYTDDIVKNLVCELGAFGIYACQNMEYDPNYNKEKNNEYKGCVKDLVKEHGISYFLDIHGLSDDHPYDLGIYYPTKFSRSKKIANLLKRGLGKGALKGANVHIFRFADNDQETLGEYVASKLRVPSVQIEVARYIREDADLLKSLVANIVEVISKDFV